MRSLWIVAALLLASPVWAQEVEVVPPAVIEAPTPAYPKGAEGDAEVVLELVIDATGSVQSVAVVEGSEPFASAARAAATDWRFSPATQGGEPFAAKINYTVAFVREEVVSPEPEAEVQEIYLPPAPAVGAIDIDVRGTKNLPPSVSSFTRAEVRQLPGAFGDPFRAIEVLPGVTPVVSGLPFFYVRGAPPGNIGYFLDGVRVPYLFHVAAGPSVVNPALVDRVDLYAGGYPARFGRFSGAIVSAETTEPDPEWKAETVVRLVDAGLFVEGGFDEGRGTVALGGRYSYTGALLSLLSPQVTLDYRDYQARITYDLTSKDRVTLFSFGSYDYLSNTEEPTTAGAPAVEQVIFGQEFYRVDGRYDRKLAEGGFLQAAATFGYDQTNLFGARNSQTLLFGTRARFEQPLDEVVTVRGGWNMEVNGYGADPRAFVDPDNPFTDQFNSLFPPRTDTGGAVWADITYKPSQYLEITPGIRFDNYYSVGTSALALDPRLAVVSRVHDRVRILHSVGIANQPPSFTVPVPGLSVASLRGGLQRSLQASSGVEVALPLAITATLTGYTGVYLNMSDAIGAQQDVTNPEIPRSLGGSKGIEIYLRRSLTERLGGFVAYTFSRTERSVGRENFAATFDRTHVLNSALGYDLGRGWKLGTRFSLFDGPPLAALAEGDGGSQRRDPPFYRIDFRAEKRWSDVFGVGWVAVVAEMINITLNRETIGGQQLPPIAIPSIGLEGGF